MSRVKSLIQMIAACEKREFDLVVKLFLKEIYHYERIVNTDGKDDVGMDVKIFDNDGSKDQYQLTIQKSVTTKEKSALKTKIFEDVSKAKENAEKFGYSNNLFFFYSYEMTNKVQREYRDEARKNYNINLEIIDANQIAEESEEHILLQEVIYNTSGQAEFKLKKSLFDNKSNNLIYDMISFGSTADIKLSIVETYILTILFETVSGLSKDVITQKCIDKFNSKEAPQFYDKLVNKLHSSTHQLCYDKENKLYFLSKEERSKIDGLSLSIRHDEEKFIEQIGEVLKRHQQDQYLDDYVEQLRVLYTNNFNERILSTNNHNDIKLDSIISFVKNIISSNLEEDAKVIIGDLISVCDDNYYLQSICARDVFSSKVNIDNLQKYAQERKIVYIDTTIALYLLCRYSCNSKDYKNYNYILSYHLLDFCNNNHVKLNITNRYMWEIGRHIQEAINLLSFAKLENFELLGGSKNVFYNFYKHLQDTDLFEGSFSEYLGELSFITGNYTTLNDQIEVHLNNIGIDVIPIQKQYNIEETKKIIDAYSINKKRPKTGFALSNDAIMLDFLGDNDTDVHIVDPIFVTWDKTLFAILNDYYKAKPKSQKWMQLTPSQFIDRYSLLSFSINETTITKEMLAILSGNIVEQTHTLLDSLSMILNPNNETGLAYANKFIKMKDSDIYMTSKESDEPQEDRANNSLDLVIHRITQHYKDRLELLRAIFLEKDLIENVMKIISDAVTNFNSSNIIDENTFTQLDQLIQATTNKQ